MYNINILFPFYLEDNLAAHNRINSYIDVLLQNNYRVNLFGLTKKYKKEWCLSDLTREKYIYHIPHHQFPKNNFVKRAFNELMFSYKLVRASKKVLADVTLITSPSMFLIPLTSNVDNNIADIRDIQWEYLNDSILTKILKGWMLKSLKKYNKVIVTNLSEKEILKDYSPEIIPNGISLDKYQKIKDEINDINKDSGKDNVVTYIGNLGIAQNILTLAKVAEHLPKVKFYIIGNGVQYQEIVKYKEQNKIENLFILGELKWEEILPYYIKSTILFAQLKKEFSIAMPSKLYEYAVTGKPILYAGVGEGANFVKQLENGYVCEPLNKDECIKHILNILENNNIELSSKNANLIKKKYIREDNSLKLLEIIEDLKEI